MENRRRTRVSLHRDVTVTVGEETLALDMGNISLNGMLCAPDDRVTQDDAVTIRIVLSPDIAIQVAGRVTRSDDEGIAIGFTDLDEEGFAHLKRLVQHNSDDADHIDRELSRTGFRSGA